MSFRETDIHDYRCSLFLRGKSKEGEGPENSEADPKKVTEVASAQGMATPDDPSTAAKKDNQMAQENPATPKIPSSSVVQEENRNVLMEVSVGNPMALPIPVPSISSVIAKAAHITEDPAPPPQAQPFPVLHQMQVFQPQQYHENMYGYQQYQQHTDPG